MNRNFVFLIITSLLFLGVACMQQKPISPANQSEESYQLNAKSGTSSGTGGGFNTNGVCGLPHHLAVTSPYENQQLQKMNLVWGSGTNNVSYNLRVREYTASGTVMYTALNLTGNSHLTPNVFMQNRPYYIELEGVCIPGPPFANPPATAGFRLGGSTSTVSSDNIDTPPYHALAMPLIGGSGTGSDLLTCGGTGAGKIARKQEGSSGSSLVAPTTPNANNTYLVAFAPIIPNLGVINYCAGALAPASNSLYAWRTFRINYTPQALGSGPLGITLPPSIATNNYGPLSGYRVLLFPDNGTCPFNSGCTMPTNGYVVQW